MFFKFIIPLLLFLTPTIVFAELPSKPVQLDWKDFRGNIYQSDDILISGQPLSHAAMQQLKDAGVHTIINLRTPEEMANPKSTPIKESEISTELGIDYIHLPSGGEEHPYSPDTVSLFAESLTDTPGKVLLHCNSGRRASHLWVAYLTNHLGVELNTAVELGQAANFGRLPLEGYLGRPLQMETPVAPSTN